MKIRVGSDETTFGTIAAGPDGRLVFDGDGPALRGLAEFYAGRLEAEAADPAALTADDLLRTMADRLAGRTWAVVVPDGPAVALSAGHDPAPRDEVALAGPDGTQAAKLLRAAKEQGADALYRLARQAVRRLAARPNPEAATRLFDPGELALLADQFARTNGTADLLGRARVRERAEAAARRAAARTFSDVPFRTFAATPAVPVLPPEKAIEYFRSLVPSLAVDPGRFGPALRREAFTLAAATDDKLLGQVKQLILQALEQGAVAPRAGLLPDGQAVEYVPHPKAAGDAELVLADPRKLDAAWQRDADYYIPPGGGGTQVPGRRAEFERFLATGEPVEAPVVSLDAGGVLSVADGRHRLSVLRDLGADRVGVMVPADQAKTFRAEFGAAADLPPVRTVGGPQAVDELLAKAGVAPENPQYAENVFRTNMMDSYVTGTMEEMAAPDVRDFFPVWQYLGIADGRQRPSHQVHFGRYYPNSVTFAQVRDSVKGAFDGFNCRCAPNPVDKYEWADLQKAGAEVSTL